MSLVALTPPITTATAERSIATLCQKQAQKHNTGEERLSGLGLLSLTDRTIDKDHFLNLFTTGKRRIIFKICRIELV